MLFIKAYNDIPIIKIIPDHSNSDMVMKIVRDEFERNKDSKNIEIDAFIEATEYIEDERCEFFNIERTDKEVSDFINSALKILYRKGHK